MFTLTYDLKRPGSAECERETALLAGSHRAGVELTHRCGGHARCGTCLVTVSEGMDHLSPVGASEARILKILKANPDQRLACQAWATGDVRCSQ